MTAELISRARAGDGEAFRELTEPHHRELQVHCYRMLGSFGDAEDALQVLPPRQLAVLILRDVLGFRASEVADMLEVTVESVTSALKRARASLRRSRPAEAGREPPPAPGSPAEDGIAAKFVRAYESADLDALVSLLTDDVFMSMPPIPLEYQGRDAVARFCAILLGSGRRTAWCRRAPTASPRSVPTCAAPMASATGPACSSSPWPATASAPLTRFESSVLARFGLPRSLPPSVA